MSLAQVAPPLSDTRQRQVHQRNDNNDALPTDDSSHADHNACP